MFDYFWAERRAAFGGSPCRRHCQSCLLVNLLHTSFHEVHTLLENLKFCSAWEHWVITWCSSAFTLISALICLLQIAIVECEGLSTPVRSLLGRVCWNEKTKISGSRISFLGKKKNNFNVFPFAQHESRTCEKCTGSIWTGLHWFHLCILLLFINCCWRRVLTRNTKIGESIFGSVYQLGRQCCLVCSSIGSCPSICLWREFSLLGHFMTNPFCVFSFRCFSFCHSCRRDHLFLNGIVRFPGFRMETSTVHLMLRVDNVLNSSFSVLKALFLLSQKEENCCFNAVTPVTVCSLVLTTE